MKAPIEHPHTVARPTERRTSEHQTPEPWPPIEYRLPSTIEGIEAGRSAKQLGLFVEQAEDTRASRLARILNTIPGIVTGDRTQCPVSYPQNHGENAAFSASVAKTVAATTIETT